MKQEKYFLVCLAMWMGFAWSCAKDEGTQDQSSAVELTAPANDAAYNLVLVEEVIFSWKSAAGASAYTLVLSKTADLSAPATKVVNGNRLPLPAADLDVMLDNLGIDYAAEAVIYWTIKPDNNANAYTEVRALKLTRLPVPVVNALSPDDNANVDLGAADKVTFRWETDVPAANFTLVFSKAADLSAPRSVQAQGYAHELSADAFDAILAELGTAAGTSQSLYWTVKPGFSEQPTYWTRTITVKRIVGTPVNITLTAPANGNATQLTKTNGTQTMTFSWSAAPTTVASAPYSLVFSANPDMSNATSINDIASTSYAISQDDLQDLLFTNSAALGLKKYKENIVYWKVKVDGRLSSGATGNIKLTGMPIFKDVRGDEAITYDVSIITYPDGRTMIWTSNNLRTKKDVHGEDLPANPPYVHDPVEDGFDPIAENAPFLLEPDRGLYYCLYRFEHDFKERIVPEGWKMPTWDDWFELYQAAADMYPQQTKWPQGNDYYTDIVALVDPKYANNDIKNHPNINAWKMNMRPTGRYLYESYGLHIDINSWPAMWFFAFDNEPRPHGTHGRGALFPGDGGPTFGYSICYSCDARQLYDSEYTGGAVMRLIYVGE